jgi:glucose-6-phosphate isomerase
MTLPTTTDPTMRLAGDAAEIVAAAIERARQERWVERLHDRDPSLWTADEAGQAAISQRLGWLDAPEHFTDQAPALEGFATGAREAGFREAIVMGMGGSSLAPDVLARTLGIADPGLPVRILDSTDPEAVAAVLDAVDPLATLFIVASKSGTTTEPLAFQAEAWARIETAMESMDARGESPGVLMVAITDPDKSLQAIPHHDELREWFLNPPDVGGRYAALTYVGLVPGALLGLDIDAVLARASSMLARTRLPDPAANPAASLGVAIGALAAAGRDKLTFLTDPAIGSFGAWVEQLIAESTGKHGTGIVPVDDEPPGEVAAYGTDRVFVRLAVGGSPEEETVALDALADALATAGHPVIRIDLDSTADIAAEFVRWEVATALAGVALGIDPFDQPNVEEAKERTRELLRAAGDGTMPADDPDPIAVDGPLALLGDTALRITEGDRSLVGELRRHLGRRRPDAYLAIQAFIAPTDERTAALGRLRRALRDATTRATTAGYGPRFLHSTGQLHKGGPPSGWFLQLTADHPLDWPIPDWPYTWGALIDAQAAGDFAAIEAHELPILRVHLGPDPDEGLAALERALAAALA